MENLITYRVKIIRLPGEDPFTEEWLERAEEEIPVEATDRHSAYFSAIEKTSIEFSGQTMEVFIDDQPHEVICGCMYCSMLESR